MKKSLITGISGQDGRHLAPLLYSMGHRVYGLVRDSGVRDHTSLRQEMPWAVLVPGDITDYSSLHRIISEIRPDEVYHLAAITFVPLSWSEPSHVISVNTIGTLNVLEAVRNIVPSARVLFACSSEIFGNTAGEQNENTNKSPASVYGLTKLDGLHLCKQYRQHHGMFVCSSISFNHESPLRPPRFVSRKITQAIARIHCGKQDILELGNIEARRDWGYALDYVDGMVKIINAPVPDDFVLATGESHSVYDWVTTCCEILEIEHPKVVSTKPNQRPEDINILCGDSRKAHKELDWYATTSFQTLVKMMLEYDLEEIRGEQRVMVVRNGNQRISYSPGKTSQAVHYE